MKTLQLITLLLGTTMLMVSCQSTDKFMDEGDYDRAISVARKKLNGKKNKKDKYVKVLEKAFAKAVKQDMDRIELLKNNGRASDWEKIILLTESIELRQRKIQPFLPLKGKDGYRARFKFVKTDEIMDYAESAVVVELYNEGNALLIQGRDGNKRAARRAYTAFVKIFKYTDQYFQADELRSEARELGISRVRIVQENASNDWMPAYLNGILLEDFPVADAFWTQFSFGADTLLSADLEARFILTSVDVGPESLRREIDQKSRRIEDGWEYVLDARGNVAKDSLGNDIRQKRFIRVYADVIRTYQEKASYVTAQMEIIDLNSGRVIASKLLNGESRFYHMGRTFTGDIRALRSRDRRYVNLLSFPSDQDLIIQAVQRLKPLFIDELKREDYVF